MPDVSAAIIGIVVLAMATYLTRIAGYFLGGHIRQDSLVARVLESLPGAALAGVLALSLSQAGVVELLAVVLATTIFLLSGRTLPAIAAGLVVAVANAHFIA